MTTRWQQRFSDEKVGVFSGDYAQSSYPVSFGNARLLVMTPEQLDACIRNWRSHWHWIPYETYNASQHTIGVAIHAIELGKVQFPPDWIAPDGIETARDLFIGYILLDALIGNGDRHHENWGFVRSRQANSSNLLYLSPTYDHASCLGRELLDDRRKVRSVESSAKKCISAFYLDANDK